MPSTIAEHLRLVPGERPLTPGVGLTEACLSIGLEVLHDLVAHVRLPQNNEDEVQALRTLLCLHRGRCPASLEHHKEELYRQVELVGEEEAGRLLEWIGGEPRRFRLLGGGRRRMIRRHILLFVLLAKVVAPVSPFQIIPILNRLGYWGGIDRLDDLLSWMPGHMVRRRSIQLHGLYLTLAREVLFADQDSRLQRPDAVSTEEFMRWPWWRQLVHLQAWHAAWKREEQGLYSPGTSSPTLLAHRIEFRLAREGAFRRLEAQGGEVARRVLRSLGYRDRPRRRGWSPRHLLFSLVLLVAAAALWCTFPSRIREWDLFNGELAEQVLQKYSGGRR